MQSERDRAGDSKSKECGNRTEAERTCDDGVVHVLLLLAQELGAHVVQRVGTQLVLPTHKESTKVRKRGSSLDLSKKGALLANDAENVKLHAAFDLDLLVLARAERL
jgi:hypothetical protein